MIEGNLNTTNLFLGIMAVVSLLQVLVLLGIAFGCFRLYRRSLQTIRDIEQRQVAPLMARVQTLMTTVDGILGDVKDVTGRVTRRTERVDAAIDQTIHSVDRTVGRVRSTVTSRVYGLMGLAQGALSIVQSVLHARRAA